MNRIGLLTVALFLVLALSACERFNWGFAGKNPPKDQPEYTVKPETTVPAK